MKNHIPQRALIIDDQHMMRSIYTKLLKDLSVAQVDTAICGSEGLKKYYSDRPDVVLLDIRMPGIDGLEVLKQIRQIDSDANVIMLTSVSDKSTVIQCLRGGAKNYILKTDEAADVKERLICIFRKLDLNRNNFLNEIRKIA